MKKTSVAIFFIFLCLLFASPFAIAQKGNSKECEEMKAKITLQNEKLLELYQKIDKQQTRIEELEKTQTPNTTSNCTAELQKKDEEIKNLKSQLAEALKNTTAGSGTNKEVDDLKKERDDWKAQAGASKAKTEALEKERDGFKTQAETSKAEVLLLKQERDGLKAQTEAIKTEAVALKQEKDIAKADYNSEKIKAANCQKDLAELKSQFSTTALEKENEELRKVFLAEIDGKIAQLVLRSDFAAAKLEAQQLKSNINAMEQRKSLPQSTNLYLSKLKAYEAMIEVIESSKKVLDNLYVVENVATVLANINTTLSSVLVKPTVDQEKLLKEQETLLKAYCGRHNYVCGKIGDADAFGADKKGATEEIDAALSRVDKKYTFLIRKLEERKKDPTNKNINLVRVACPTN